MMLGWLDRVSQAGTHLREGSSLESPGVQGEREGQWPCKKMGGSQAPLHPHPKGKRERESAFPPGEAGSMASLGEALSAYALKAQLRAQPGAEEATPPQDQRAGGRRCTFNARHVSRAGAAAASGFLPQPCPPPHPYGSAGRCAAGREPAPTTWSPAPAAPDLPRPVRSALQSRSSPAYATRSPAPVAPPRPWSPAPATHSPAPARH